MCDPIAQNKGRRDFAIIFGENPDIARAFAAAQGWKGDLLSSSQAFPAFLRTADSCEVAAGQPIPVRERIEAELSRLPEDTIVYVQLSKAEIMMMRELAGTGLRERMSFFITYLIDSRLTSIMIAFLAKHVAVALKDNNFIHSKPLVALGPIKTA